MLSQGNWPQIHQVIERIRTSSALNPLLWLCGLVTLPAWSVATWALSGWLQIAMFCIGTAPPACAVVAYFLLLSRDPDRLQSERFQLTRQRYSLIGDDLQRGQTIDAEAEVITNPVTEEALRVEPNVYLIVFNTSGSMELVSSLQRYIMDSKDIVAYWNHIPLVYAVKNYQSLPILRQKLQGILGNNQFLIAQIYPHQVDGLLPRAAWDWFSHSHGQMSVAQLLEREFS